MQQWTRRKERHRHGRRSQTAGGSSFGSRTHKSRTQLGQANNGDVPRRVSRESSVAFGGSLSGPRSQSQTGTRHQGRVGGSLRHVGPLFSEHWGKDGRRRPWRDRVAATIRWVWEGTLRGVCVGLRAGPVQGLCGEKGWGCGPVQGVKVSVGALVAVATAAEASRNLRARLESVPRACARHGRQGHTQFWGVGATASPTVHAGAGEGLGMPPWAACVRGTAGKGTGWKGGRNGVVHDWEGGAVCASGATI